MVKRLIVKNIGQLLTLAGVVKEQGKQPSEESLGIVSNAVLVSKKGRVEWSGSAQDFAESGIEVDASWNSVDAKGCVVMPALIDSHTHALFADSRQKEFAQILEGVSYREIAARGGGILATVKAVRQASLEELITLTLPRLEQAARFGVATLEIKSGYGLSLNDELKMLRVIQKLQQITPLTLVPTLLAAHAIPPEFADHPDSWLDQICKELLPAVAEEKLALFCDIFVEKGYFSIAQAERLFEAALIHGFKLKLHAEQLSAMGSCKLATRYPLTSVDHLEQLSPSDIPLLATRDLTAVLLPGVALCLRLPSPPARALIQNGIPVAIATDFNPGSCPSQHLPLMMTLGGFLFGMTIPELLVATTYNAALAVGREKDEGSLINGKRANFIILDCREYEELLYSFGPSHIHALYVDGKNVV